MYKKDVLYNHDVTQIAIITYLTHEELLEDFDYHIDLCRLTAQVEYGFCDQKLLFDYDDELVMIYLLMIKE